MGRFVVLFLLLAFGFNGYSQTNYYFSNLGNNSNAGTISSPFANASKIASLSLNTGDSLLFRAGDTFYETATITLGSQIIVSRYGVGANPLISGLTNLTSWTNEGSNIWSATLNSGNNEPVVVFGNKMIEPGRYPNTAGTWQRMSNYSNSGSLVTLTGDLPSTPSFVGGKAVVMVREWIINKGRITAHSGSNLTYYNTVLQNGSQFLPETTSGFGYFIIDHPSTLDIQNEWYYDSTANKLKVYSTSNPGTWKASILDRLINITSNNVRIIGVDLEGARKELVFADDKQNIQIKKCNLAYSGIEGINLVTTLNPVIDSCSFRWCSNRAIQLTNVFGNIRATVTNNSLTNIGMLLGQAVSDNKSGEGIYVYGDSSKIRFNTLDSIGYNGIDFGGSNAHVDSNFVNNATYWQTDGGAIYTSGDGHDSETGWTITNNITINSRGYRFGTYGSNARAFGVYLDEEKMRGFVSRNTSAFNNEGGFYGHKSDSTEFAYNMFALNNGSQFRDFQDDASQPTRWLKAYNNVFYAKSGSYIYEFGENPTPALDSFFRLLDNNILARPSGLSNSIRVLQNFASDTYFSPASWKSAKASAAYTPYDANSTTGHPRFSSGVVRLEYNATRVPRKMAIDTGHFDIYGTKYIDSIIIAPYSSALIVSDTTNDAPVANAGTDKVVNLPTTTTTLTGSGSDVDGTVTYLWSVISGGGTIASPTSATTNLTGLTTAGVRYYQLAVTDNYGQIRRDTVQVTVTAVNVLPSANAGADQVINTSSGTLSGSGTDADGTIASYAWVKLSGTGGSIINPSSANASIMGLSYGNYSYQLTVTDNSGGTATDVVNIRYNRPPNVSAGVDATITLPTSSVSLNGSANDVDGTYTLAWTKLSGPTYAINSTNIPNPVLSSLLAGTYVFRLTATDNDGAVTTDDVTLVVLPVVVIVSPTAIQIPGIYKIKEKP